MAVSKTLRYQVLRRDNYTCRYCGRGAPEVKLTIDHVVAEALGGRDEPSNLVAACADCNSGKSATPTDAAMVAGVAEDALRWSRAVAHAASLMLADLVTREADRTAFEARWNTWTAGTSPIPLPPDWRASVDRFLTAGLPLPVLLDCVDIAMGNRKLRRDGLFRYMCGIAWARVNQLHEVASKTVGPPPAEGASPDRLAERLADALQANLGRPEFERLVDRARESLADAGFESPSIDEALVQCVELIHLDLDEARGGIYLLGHLARRSVPPSKLDALVKATGDELRRNLEDEWTEEEFEFNLVRHAIGGLGELAKRAAD